MFLAYLALYICVGVIVSGNTLTDGRVGSAGLFPSFIFQTLFWPLFILLRL